MRELLKYKHKYRSQNGEDGVLEEIFKRLGIKIGWFVDVGAWDGEHLSNTFKLLEREGWWGVGIEVDEGRYNGLVRTANAHPGRLYPVWKKVVLEEGKPAATIPEGTLNEILEDTSS